MFKIAVDAQQLHNASNIARQATFKAQRTLPALQFMKLTALDGKIQIRATDLEKMVWITLPGEIEDDGELSIPIQLVQTFTRKEKGKVIIQEVKPGQAVITGSEQGGSAKLSMDALGPEAQVPDQTWGEDLLQAKPGPDFAQSLSMALTCAAYAESRPILTGVLIDGQDGQLALAAADGFRLFHRKLGVKVPKFQAIIPGATAHLIARTMAKGDITMWYNKEKETAVFECDSIIIVTQLIRGTFPAYLQLIPSGDPTWTFECSSPLFEQRLSQYQPKDPAIMRLRWDNHESALRLEMGVGYDYEFSAHYTSLVPATVTGDNEGKIAANQLYLTQAIKFFSSVKFEMTSPSSPMVISGDIEDLEVVLMPMFVQW